MAKIGMDADVIEGIGKNLQNQADAIANVISAVNGLIGQAEQNWQGTDATQFKSLWDGQHRPALQRAHDAVQDLSRSAIHNARDQRSTSSQFSR